MTVPVSLYKLKLKHFDVSDFGCKCGCGKLPPESTMLLADRIREECGYALDVHSAARCPAHNATEGGAKGSAHLSGEAVDLAPIDGKRIHEFQEFCAKHTEHFDVYIEDPSQTPTWCHVQTRRTNSGRRIFKK